MMPVCYISFFVGRKTEDGRPKPAYRQRLAGLYLISTNFFPVEIYYW